MKFLYAVLLLMITLNSSAQIEIINRNIGIGQYAPDVPVHIKADTLKIENESNSQLLFMNKNGHLGFGRLPGIQRLDIQGDINVRTGSIFLSDVSLSSNNKSWLKLSSNHSSVSRLILADKEGSKYGQLYGKNEGDQFGLLDADNQWAFLIQKNESVEFRIENAPKYHISNNTVFQNPSRLLIGWSQSGNREINIDLLGDDMHSDFGMRITRKGNGPNSASQILHRGSGPMEIINLNDGDIDMKTSNTSRFTIIAQPSGNNNEEGNIGIGTTSPDERLHVAGNILYMGSMINASDKRLKKNIKSFEYGLKEVLQLKTVSYHLKPEIGFKSKDQKVGLLAQEVEKIAPELVRSFRWNDHNKKGLHSRNGDQEFLAIEESTIKYMLINALQEQQRQIDELYEKIDQLSSKLASYHIDGSTMENESSQLINTTQFFLGHCIPNPADDLVSIPYKIPGHQGAASIDLFNRTGRLITSFDLSQSDQGILEINTTHLSGGSYVYSLVVQGKIIFSRQFIVAH